MLHKRKLEDYVKTIYMLRSNGMVRGAYIAKALKVSKPTVSVALKTLEKEGYLRVMENHAVVLTDKGTILAEEVIKRNHAFYFLLTNLGVDEDTAMKDACNMEHAISSKSFLALLSLSQCQFDARKTAEG